MISLSEGAAHKIKQLVATGAVKVEVRRGFGKSGMRILMERT